MVMLEAAGQGFYEWLDDVYTSGRRFVAERVPVALHYPGAPTQQRILDFIYEPVVDEYGQVTGIFCEGHDVTENHAAQAALRENDARLRELNATLEQRVSDALAERRILAEIGESYTRLTDPRAQRAFIHTIRAVIDVAGY